MQRENRRKFCGILFALIIISVSLTPQFRMLVTFPQQLHLLEGQEENLYFGFPVNVYLRANREGIVSINGNPLSPETAKVNLGTPVELQPNQQGEAEVELLLFGVPVRRMVVNVLPPVEVIPGGHSIGVLLLSHGVLVVGEAGISEGGFGQKSPAEEAGIQVGDTIHKINGQQVKSVIEMADLVDRLGSEGEKLRIEYKRGDTFFVTETEALLCRETGRYRIGLYVRDGANGVGTLSFYHPETGRYGALGHVITDIDTNQPLNVEEGSVVEALVSGINRGSKGQPGEKIGVFSDKDGAMGDIEENSNFGIFGTLHNPIENPYYSDPVPVALASQVSAGPAQIMTVINRDRIERFEVEIVRVFNQNTPSDKGLVVKITDDRLLEATGGIVQGMSGSPIMQDGRLVGVVTHVFVNDPAKGYGILAEWMLYQLDVIPLANARGYL